MVRTETPAATPVADESRRSTATPRICSFLKARHEDSAGVGERGIGAKGYPGTWEISALPTEGFFFSVGIAEPRGTKVNRDEGREVVAARSTEEVGIAAQATPRREGAAWSWSRAEERWSGH